MPLIPILLSHPGVWMALMVSVTALCVAVVRKILKIAQRFDHPNARSNHTKPIVRGGGLGLLAAALPAAWLLGTPPMLLMIVGLLSLIFFIDDLRPLPASLRFAAQCAGLISAFLLVPSLHPLSLLQPYATHIEAWMLWPVGAVALLGGLWWLNLYNFMDGIDGLAATELACIAFGTAVLSAALPALPAHVALLSGVLLAASYGFLAWNWHPARIFLGDSGSVPLGLLTGYLLWQIAAAGAFTAALLLPAYFLMDATGTLMLRAARREKLTEAHSAHAYQRAVRGGMKQSAVVGRVALLNLLLLGLAILSLSGEVVGWLCVAAGYAAAFLMWLRLGGGWQAMHAAPPALQTADSSRTHPETHGIGGPA